MPLLCRSAVLKANSIPVNGRCPVELRPVVFTAAGVSQEENLEAQAPDMNLEPTINLEQVAEEAETILARARVDAEALKQQAFRDGRAEGRQAGLAAARVEAEGVLVRAGGLLESVAEERARILEGLEAEIRDLALDLAAILYREQLALDNQHVIRLAREAISRLCQGEKFTLWANSRNLARLIEQEVQLLQALPAKAALSIKGEDGISPGGVILENENGFVDATVEGQLAQLRSSLEGGEPDVPKWLAREPGQVP